MMRKSPKKEVRKLLEWLCAKWNLVGVIVDHNGELYCPPVVYSSAGDYFIQNFDWKLLTEHYQSIIQSFQDIQDSQMVNGRLTFRPSILISPLYLTCEKYYLIVGYFLDKKTRSYLQVTLPTNSIWLQVLPLIPNTSLIVQQKIKEDIQIFRSIIECFHSLKTNKGSPPKEKPEKSELTEREKVIVQLIQNGLKNREIAEELGVSINTIKSHISSIFSKLQVSSRKELSQHSIS